MGAYEKCLHEQGAMPYKSMDKEQRAYSFMKATTSDRLERKKLEEEIEALEAKSKQQDIDSNKQEN